MQGETKRSVREVLRQDEHRGSLRVDIARWGEKKGGWKHCMREDFTSRSGCAEALISEMQYTCLRGV